MPSQWEKKVSYGCYFAHLSLILMIEKQQIGKSYSLCNSKCLFFAPMYIDGYYMEISKYKIVSEIDILIICRKSTRRNRYGKLYIIILSTHSLK